MFHVNIENHNEGMKFESPITALGIAKLCNIEAIAAKIDNQVCDLFTSIYEDCKLDFIHIKSQEGLEILRHDAAHLLAEALKTFDPEIQIAIGPNIANGFYYDFYRKIPLSEKDLGEIEKIMHSIAKKSEKFERMIWTRNQALEFFKSANEKYKVDLIESIPDNEQISVYKQGQFVDLCRGPHGISTKHLRHFKLLKIAGAYFRGDSKNEMLQRIYGTAFSSKEELDQHLFMLEEAEKRDHRKIGQELDLFHIQEEAKGMAFWHEKGWILYRTVENYMRQKLEKNGYFEVKTPMLLDRKLWEMSGHWEKFKENMFTVEIEDETLALKPMSCPCHVQIFKQGTKSYRDLPLRMAEFGSCHRNEPSGALHGLMRVRHFVQDDAHIFCTEDQINEETVKFCELLKEIYEDFGFKDFKIKFSDRPKLRAGSDEIWNKAETALHKAIKKAGFDYTMNPGEGAFYGPKLEFNLKDAIGRDWQCGTLQVDFVLPERLNASYINQSGEKERPVILHRAIIGTLERFIGILIEHHAGNFPLWLAPIQVAVAPITNNNDEFAKRIYEQLKVANIRSTINLSSEKISYKIREFSTQKIPFIVVVGKKEEESGVLSVRKFGSEEQLMLTLEELILMISKHKACNV